MKWLLLLLPIVCCAHPLDDGYAAYLRGESATTVSEAEAAFNEALAHYLSVQGSSPWLAFNLGNTYFQLGEPATALYHYSRAQQLAPRSRQIRTHLRLASRRLGVAAKPAFLRRLCGVQLLTPHERNLLIFVLGSLATLMLAFRIRFALIPASLAIFLSATLIYLHVLADPEAILLKSAMLRCDAGTQYAPVCEKPLPAGTRLRLAGQHDEWVKIVLFNGETGFVLADSLGIL